MKFKVNIQKLNADLDWYFPPDQKKKIIQVLKKYIDWNNIEKRHKKPRTF